MARITPDLPRKGVTTMADPLDLMNEHAMLIGSVVIAYNKVQHLILGLFVAFIRMPAEQAMLRKLENDGLI